LISPFIKPIRRGFVGCGAGISIGCVNLSILIILAFSILIVNTPIRANYERRHYAF
jgi:hypothetical protein